MKNFLPKRLERGFTLIELLIVIGILTVLFAIVLVAVNPARQFSQANDTQRRSDVNAILNGVHQFAAEKKGVLPTGIDSTVRTVCGPTGTVPCPAATSVNLCIGADSLVPNFLADLPIDPKDGTESPTGSKCNDVGASYFTDYTAQSSGAAAGNRITVCAGGEITASICVTR